MAVIKDTALVVDLDGTLIRSDLLHEAVWHSLTRHPFTFLKATWWLLSTGSKAKFKHELAKSFSFEPELLPYNSEVLSLIAEYRAAGQKVVLASASNQVLVDKISAHLGLFDTALGSNAEGNLAGNQKSLALQDLLGSQKFTYVGNSEADLGVWKFSHGAIVVSRSQRLLAKAVRINKDAELLRMNDSPSTLKTWLKQLRIYQWLKNTLIFVPLLAAFAPWDLVQVTSLIAAFASFSFVASAVYVVNDLFDLDNDRGHHSKRFRPLADGRILALHGLVASVTLLILGLVLGFAVNVTFGIIIFGYFLLTLAYSKFLKSIAIIDAIVLAFLYTVRVIAGGVVAEVPVSYWLLSFSVFFFLSLSWVKRYAELHAGQSSGKLSAPGRGYTVADFPIILAFGVGSGFISILVFALYLDSPAVIQNYSTPVIAWLAIPVVIYLLSRIWLLAQRGAMKEDPLTFVMTDKTSLFSILIIGCVLILAHLGVVS